MKRFKKQYKQRTDLPDVINDIVNPVLEKIHKEQSWHGELEFKSEGSKVKIIKYEPGVDYAIIQLDERESIEVNKLWVKELYDKRINN